MPWDVHKLGIWESFPSLPLSPYEWGARGEREKERLHYCTPWTGWHLWGEKSAHTHMHGEGHPWKKTLRWWVKKITHREIHTQTVHWTGEMNDVRIWNYSSGYLMVCPHSSLHLLSSPILLSFPLLSCVYCCLCLQAILVMSVSVCVWRRIIWEQYSGLLKENH